MTLFPAITVLRNEVRHAFRDRRRFEDQEWNRRFIRSCIAAIRVLESQNQQKAPA